MVVLILLLIAAIIFGLDFFAGLSGGSVRQDASGAIMQWHTTRWGSLSMCLVCIALAMWHAGH